MRFDPIFGRGFFCPASNSLRVIPSSANAWRHSFFIAVDPTAPVTPRISIPDHKNGNPIAALKKEGRLETDLTGKNVQ
jgi:hypothetical protein